MTPEKVTKLRTWVKVRNHFRRIRAKKAEIKTADPPLQVDTLDDVSLVEHSESLPSPKESQVSINRSYWMLLIPPSMREEVGGDFYESYQTLKAEGKSFWELHIKMVDNLIVFWWSLVAVWFRPFYSVIDRELDILARQLRELLIFLGLW